MRRTHPEDLWIEVGFLPKPHGMHEWLEFRPHSGSLDALELGRLLRLTLPAGSQQDTTLTGLRPFKNGALITLRDVTTHDQASALRGAKVEVRRADLGVLDDGEVFLADLLGLEAVLPDGAVAGVVKDIADTGPVATLIVQGPLGGTLPWHEEWVGEPDWAAGRLPIHRRPIA